MIYDPSIYRVYTSPEQLPGMDFFELYPGEFDGGTTFWNPGSIYINEDGFLPFAPLVRVVAPDFKWWGKTRLAGRQLVQLGGWLDRFRTVLAQARSAADLRSRLSARIEVDDETYLAVRSLLTRAVEEIDHVVWLAAGRRHGLWVFGP